MNRLNSVLNTIKNNINVNFSCKKEIIRLIIEFKIEDELIEILTLIKNEKSIKNKIEELDSIKTIILILIIISEDYKDNKNEIYEYLNKKNNEIIIKEYNCLINKYDNSFNNNNLLKKPINDYFYEKNKKNKYLKMIIELNELKKKLKVQKEKRRLFIREEIIKEKIKEKEKEIRNKLIIEKIVIDNKTEMELSNLNLPELQLNFYKIYLLNNEFNINNAKIKKIYFFNCNINNIKFNKTVLNELVFEKCNISDDIDLSNIKIKKEFKIINSRLKNGGLFLNYNKEYKAKITIDNIEAEDYCFYFEDSIFIKDIKINNITGKDFYIKFLRNEFKEIKLEIINNIKINNNNNNNNKYFLMFENNKLNLDFIFQDNKINNNNISISYNKIDSYNNYSSFLIKNNELENIDFNNNKFNLNGYYYFNYENFKEKLKKEEQKNIITSIIRTYIKDKISFNKNIMDILNEVKINELINKLKNKISLKEDEIDFILLKFNKKEIIEEVFNNNIFKKRFLYMFQKKSLIIENNKINNLIFKETEILDNTNQKKWYIENNNINLLNLRLLKGIENLDEISFRNSNIKKLDITNLNFNCVPDLTNIKLENELSLHNIKVEITNSKEDKDRLRKLKTIAEENKDVDSYLIFNSLELEAKEANKHLNKIYGEISSYGTSVSKPLKCLFWWDIIFILNYFLILYSNNLQINLNNFILIIKFTIINNIPFIQIIRNPNKDYFEYFYPEFIEKGILAIPILDGLLISFHLMVSFGLIFLIGLGIRNKFRLK